MAKEFWTNNVTGEVMEFTEGETFVMLRTTEGTGWKKRLTAVEFMVCISFAEEMNKKGRLSLSIGGRKRIARENEISERTVSDSLKSLEEKNILVHIGGGDYMMNPEIFFRRPARGMSKYIEEYYRIRTMIAKGTS